MYKKNLVLSLLMTAKRGKTAFVLLTLAVLFFTFSLPVLAATDFGLGYGTYLGLGTQDIRVTVMNIVRVLLGFLGIIALVLVIYAGYLWMSSVGNEEKITQAKAILRNAAIGLVIIFSAFAIVSFIIGMLTGSLGGGSQIPGTVVPPTGCENCGYLGGGVIESVYPLPLATEVPRDTSVVVTFKEEIKPETIMDIEPGAVCVAGSSNPCANKNLAVSGNKSNVRIFKSAEGEDKALGAAQVRVTTSDKKTYTFIPAGALGDETSKYWYTVKLSSALVKESNNESAFVGAGNSFSWTFEVGSKLDLKSPVVSSVFPTPDNNHDSYSAVKDAQATGSITVNDLPKVDRDALATIASIPINPNNAQIKLSGNYNFEYAGVLTAVVSEDRSSILATWSPANSLGAASYPIDAKTKTVTLNNGILVVFQDDLYAGGMQFKINFIPKTSADTLQIGNTTYKFSRTSTAGNDIIVTGSNSTANKALLAARIADKIHSQIQAPDMNAAVDKKNSLKINLTAVLAGSTGNTITVGTTGSWAVIGNMSGGIDLSTTAECQDGCDQPRNAVLRIDFSEAILPTLAVGKAEINTVSGNPAGIGTLKSGTYSNIMVQADVNDNGVFEDNEFVNGTFVQSNLYQTVEFISLQPCLDAKNKTIINSCGDKLFCLPVVANKDYVKYRVIVKAARLRSCVDDNSCSNLRYEDATQTTLCENIPVGATSLATGQSKACGNVDGIFYMKADGVPAGLTDIANNSFDGNKNGFAQGPTEQSLVKAFGLNANAFSQACDLQASGATQGINCADDSNVCKDNSEADKPGSCRLTGDDLVWEFYIRNKIEVAAPVVLSVTPNVTGTGSSLTSPITAKFNKLLQSSTVKPGSGYTDGSCTCNNDADCQDADQKCTEVGTSKYCVNQTQEQVYCARDNQCKSGRICETKKYITLKDVTTQPVGWWVSNVGEDARVCLNDARAYKDCTKKADCSTSGSTGVCSLKDGYSDRSQAWINHTRFLESTQYGAELASGVKDIYQNCFVPGKGPNGQIKHCSVSTATVCTDNANCPTGEVCIGVCEPYSKTGCCGVSATNLPYCCNGVASATVCQ
ncbi:MAG: pilin [Candidatus Buchananbacteria bacterium]